MKKTTTRATKRPQYKAKLVKIPEEPFLTLSKSAKKR